MNKTHITKIISNIVYWSIFSIINLYNGFNLLILGTCVIVDGNCIATGELCCELISVWGKTFGLEYYAANILLFCILGPLFFLAAVILGFIGLKTSHKTTINWLLKGVLLLASLLLVSVIGLVVPGLSVN